MSSHHFVRDKQEPLLIVQSLAPDLMESFVQLLEWSPEIVVVNTEKNISLLESYDLLPDWLLMKDKKTLVNNNSYEEFSLPDIELETLAQQLNYTTYNTIVAETFSEYKLSLNQGQAKGLVKVVLMDALIQCCNRQYKKWLPIHSQLFIHCKNLECLNIDLNYKNSSFVTNRKSDGFEMLLENDLLLELSFDGNFNIVEFF